MVHQVDLRDHGMYTAGGKHELTFLTIPNAFYGLMSEPRGRPNRVPLDEYRRALDESPVDYRILVTHLVGAGELPEPCEISEIDPELLDRARCMVGEIQPRLIPRFRQQAVDDLAVAGFRIHATRRPDVAAVRNARGAARRRRA